MTIKKETWISVGVLLWGIPISVFSSIYCAFLKAGTLTEIQDFSWPTFIQTILISLPICMLVGALLGLGMYRLGQKG